jgi:pathogenesis-related protein 1
MRSSLPCCLLTLVCLVVGPVGCDFGDGGSPQPDGGTPPDSGPSPDGGPSADSDFAREMISAHNSVRISATPTPNPALPALTWSSAAAATAQAWADQCQFKHNPNRGNLGENIAAATPNSLTTMGVVQNWAAESAYYDYGTNSCAPNRICGHYTQIVWRNTTQVGCAMARCNQNSPFSGSAQWWFWVCNYSPPGNYVGQRPY